MVIKFYILFFVIFAVTLKESSSGSSPAFDANSCDQGCKVASDCPTNAHCVAVTQSSDCGLCLCQNGYRTQGGNCVPNDKSKSGGSKDQKSGGGGAVTTTAASQASTTQATTSTSAGPTTQGPPPGASPLVCSDYACETKIQSSSDDHPFTVRAQLFNESSTPGCKRKLNVGPRPCKMSGGGGDCFGVYCLTIEPGNDYCICDFYRVDRQCAIDKPGKCESATGQLPALAYQAQNKRYRNKNNPDHGSVYGRHFASSLSDCIKLCQWSEGACRSINYGTLAGQPMCELLSVTVTKGSLTEPWVVSAPGWQHAQVVMQ